MIHFKIINMVQVKVSINMVKMILTKSLKELEQTLFIGQVASMVGWIQIKFVLCGGYFHKMASELRKLAK